MLADKITMISKYNFELFLERAAERFYFNGASQHGKTRGGNSSDNEVYFKSVASDLRRDLECQQILLKKGACPDSGVFGEFYYKIEEDIDWDLVSKKKIVVFEISGVERQPRFIEVKVEELGEVKEPVSKSSGLKFHLNKLNGYGEFFGVEYKAAKSASEKSINVASFNSTCPSATKTTSLSKVKMYHNFDSKNKCEMHGNILSVCEVTLEISFSIYYLIVNDSIRDGSPTINQIFICDGGFFAPGVSEEDAKKLSKQLYPQDLGIECNLYRVGLRYRPFFDSKTIKTAGYGLYTSWDPKIPKEEKVEKQRQALLDEIETIQQNFSNSDQEEVPSHEPENYPDNVIYLSLRETRIKKRAA
jgi:hypothetical protein